MPKDLPIPCFYDAWAESSQGNRVTQHPPERQSDYVHTANQRTSDTIQRQVSDRNKHRQPTVHTE